MRFRCPLICSCTGNPRRYGSSKSISFSNFAQIQLNLSQKQRHWFQNWNSIDEKKLIFEKNGLDTCLLYYYFYARICVYAAGVCFDVDSAICLKLCATQCTNQSSSMKTRWLKTFMIATMIQTPKEIEPVFLVFHAKQMFSSNVYCK